MYYVFEPALKLSATATRMATVHVFTAGNVKVGSYSFSRSNPSAREIEGMAVAVWSEVQAARMWDGKKVLV